MSEEDFPKYKDGDVVWVKLGPTWWPGEVTENGPEDLNVKKPPLVIVKFFKETTFEFVKSYKHIYFYNCERKNEFIRKGMDSFRANNSHMEKFPMDVSMAEMLTEGNPNILSDPMFAPQKRSSIIAEVFGTPVQKKTPKEGKGQRGRPSSSKNSPKKSSKLNITHRRFLGFDDYEAHIRVQYHGKDGDNLSGEENTTPVPEEPSKIYPCSSCTFKTNRIDVMMFHVQCHIKGIESPLPVKKKSPVKRMKKPRIKHITSDDVNNSSTGYLDSDSEEEIPKPKQKRKRRTQGGSSKSKQKKLLDDEKPTTDIRSNLLAEWSDSEENGDEGETSNINTSGDAFDTDERTSAKGKESKKQDDQQKDLIKSCFDFEEEEEEDNSIVHTAVGRKIPRVIPPSEKRKSTDPDNEDASLPVAEDDENRMEILKVNENLNESSNSTINDADLAKDESVFKDLMDSTSVPELPEIVDPTKSTQNFPDSKTVKMPDKLTKNENFTEVATKLTNPKKRFVKSFEDFELLQNEQRKAQEEKEKPVDEKKETTIEETQVKEVEKKEEEPKSGSSKKEEVTEEEVKEISPKEDTKIEEEPKIDEIIRKDEPIKEDSKSASVETQEDEKSKEDEKTDDSNLKISKLKCQIMSKLSDEECESPKIRTRSSHKTPRSKILESYRNDTSTEKRARSSVDEEELFKPDVVVSSASKKEKPATKKSKFLKYQESPESEEKIETEQPVAITKPEEPPKVEVVREVQLIPEKLHDEVINKPVNQIDDYLNDFLFNFDKKPETTPKTEETTPGENADNVDPKVDNEVHIKCASNDDESGSGIDIAIKTNLTNFSKDEDEMSALSTLAMMSELETNAESKTPVSTEVVAEPTVTSPRTAFKEHFTKKIEPELVPIDGTLTVVSEKELADAQVEITASTSPSSKKPVTLTNFSMDFAEGNSSEQQEIEKTEQIKKEIVVGTKSTTMGDVCDLEEHIPSQIVDKSKPEKTPSKLLERLTTVEVKPSKDVVQASPKVSKVPVTPTKDNARIQPPKTKLVVKSAIPKITKSPLTSPQTTSKPIILSEKIIKPEKTPIELAGTVSVQKITSKRIMQDADEIDTFIIQKESNKDDEIMEKIIEEVPAKKSRRIESKKISPAITSTTLTAKKRGKPKILQQTIITPAGEIIQPNQPQTSTASVDDKFFDINSMPIVLSDQILTPESIENMPICLSDDSSSTTAKIHQQTIVKKQPQGQMRLLNKALTTSPLVGQVTTTTTTPKGMKTKILSNVGQKMIKQNSFSAGSSKHGKYVIVTQPSSTTPTSRFTVGKKQTIIKRGSGEMTVPSGGTLTKVQNVTPESSGNKIMIWTNPQGQQQRLLLTPAQQKMMMGYQTTPGGKTTKTFVKGNIIQKTKETAHMSPMASSSGIVSKTISSRLNSNQTLISSSGHVLTPIQQTKTVRINKAATSTTPKLQITSQKVSIKPQKTILIKNQHGQTVRKIQGTDDALLDQQVAEQIEAIKASGGLQPKQDILNYKSMSSKSLRRSYVKKPMDSPKLVPKREVAATAIVSKADSGIPPLAPISPKKPEHVQQQQSEKVVTTSPDTKTASDRPLNQLVIQDAMGNQTTITEGQILALPSETIDGQPQSYVLVTLDESGNLTPLNNEALMSLDPNLGLGGELGNSVLQIDQSALKDETAVAVNEPVDNNTVGKVEETVVAEPIQQEIITEQQEVIEEKPIETVVEETPSQEQNIDSSVLQTVNCSVGGDPNQQLIVTGDPIAAQKFLESLTEGNTDLANILASAEGSSILIHADGQQILINTDSDNQMLYSVNADNLNMTESSEGGGNPIFATQPSKNQDILAAALADTDVFQQEQNGSQSSKTMQSQLSPNSALYPMNVGNVLETSLTLNSPIMTPLEVPSTNSKKISDENDILSQVPKNVDLPITITDPNISQTVAQQQVASLMVNELQNNLELSLPISDSAITVASSEMNSPSFVYSLPNLDGSVDINQKPFNSSMPLLTEDTEEVSSNETQKDKGKSDDAIIEESTKSSEDKVESKSAENSFLDENEGLCTLGGEMCSSLSEPPPDMFDLSAVLSSHQIKSNEETKSMEMMAEEAELKIDDKGGDESASSESINPDTASITETSSPNTVNEDSCEIPVQPEIVTNLESDGFRPITEDNHNKRNCSEMDENDDSKKCKFD